MKYFFKGRSIEEFSKLPREVQSTTVNGSQRGGLVTFDPRREVFRQFTHDPANPNSLSSNRVSALFEDSKGSLWVGTEGGGSNLLKRFADTHVHSRSEAVAKALKEKLL